MNIKRMWYAIIGKPMQEKKLYPYKFAKIVLSEHARAHGITSDLNKEIYVFVGGKLKEVMPYTLSHVEALRQVQKIPVEEWFDDDEFEFRNEINSGSVRTRR